MLWEKLKFVPVLSDQDLTDAANMDGDSINMSEYHSATFLVSIQDLGGAAPSFLLYSGATDAAMTSALTFNYALGSAAQGTALCDVLGANATSASLSLAHATYDNYMLLMHVDASDMDVANGENWLTFRITDPGGCTGNVSVTAILEPRYVENQHRTALV